MDRFSPTCLSIDLEVGKKDGKINEFAAVRGDTGAVFLCTGSELAARLDQLTTFAEGASFLLCHNIVAFDRCHGANGLEFDHAAVVELTTADWLRLVS